MNNDEERIALFLDYENLAIGAREQLHLAEFNFRPVADALAERGRVVVRRAYADWSRFDEDRRMLTRHHVELIEIPQRMGSVRKNAADIKMAVDAIELCFERDYITTFVLGTGDSDFTPLVHKLRELNRRVIGIGVEASTSALLPPACDEFLFYERLEGVEPVEARRAPSRSSRTKRAPAVEKEAVADALAERGRVVVRRAYADWSRFDEDRRMLTRHHVELIEIPQRM
ncbi:MAG TPA: NYN domain-containing protein, partial [Acidimicrobiia bacterium]|nr:NYN domain-containing protein [Acidimicrobiia bacterium]